MRAVCCGGVTLAVRAGMGRRLGPRQQKQLATHGLTQRRSLRVCGRGPRATPPLATRTVQPYPLCPQAPTQPAAVGPDVEPALALAWRPPRAAAQPAAFASCVRVRVVARPRWALALQQAHLLLAVWVGQAQRMRLAGGGSGVGSCVARAHSPGSGLAMPRPAASAGELCAACTFVAAAALLSCIMPQPTQHPQVPPLCGL